MLKHVRYALFLLALATLGGLPAPAAPLQRWIYCAQNLWVDKNIDELETLFQRAAKAGYGSAVP